jgi:acyl-CoA thioesterase YciA
MMPFETNGMGNIFGGMLLSYMDLAGSYVARRVCSNHFIHRCVTRFMDKVEFKQAVHVNDVISCYGTVTKVGTTSIKVHVEVEADRAGEIIPVTQADLVFVAVDEAGKPAAVVCSTEGKTSTGRTRKTGARTRTTSGGKQPKKGAPSRGAKNAGGSQAAARGCGCAGKHGK